MYDAIESQLPPLESFVPPDVVADECAGMSAEQVRELANDSLFTVGVHTVDHPLLTHCSEEEAWRQVIDNKRWLESVTGKRCDLLAYPAGDYNHRVLEDCRRAGFRHAFAVVPRKSLPDSQLAIPRNGLYSRSLTPLILKLWCGHWLPAQSIQKARTLWFSCWRTLLGLSSVCVVSESNRGPL
jgi:hypothetical protein